MVYCGIYPVDGSEYEPLKEAIEKKKQEEANKKLSIKNALFIFVATR